MIDHFSMSIGGGAEHMGAPRTSNINKIQGNIELATKYNITHQNSHWRESLLDIQTMTVHTPG